MARPRPLCGPARRPPSPRGLLAPPGRVLLAAAAALCLTAARADAQDLERLFYYVDRESAYRSLERNIGDISVVAPAAFSADGDGVVWGEVDPRVLHLAREHGVRVMPLVHNPGFDQEMVHRLVRDSAARARTVESLARLCRRHDFHGIQFDFENVHLRDRDAYTRFYREAAAGLHAAGCRISVAVVHRPNRLAGPTRYHKWLFKNWRAGYDLEALAEAGDFVSVMTYSQHTRRTPPGPQAGIPWVREVVEHFLRHVPADKLSLGIPVSSQRWYTSQEDDVRPEMARSYSETVSWERARALVERYGAEVRWDGRARVPFAYYSREGVYEWVFMEDARSFRAKLDLAREYGLRGFSVWVLGREDPGIWEELP